MAFFTPVDSPRTMGNTNTFQQARKAVVRLAGWQFALTVALALVTRAAFDSHAALSAFVGGSIGVIAGFYQAQRLLRVDAAGHPEMFMRGLWVSEGVKIFLTVALFVLAIRTLKVTMVPTIVGYSVTYLVYWAALATGYPWFEPQVSSNNDRDRNWPGN